MKIPKKIDYSPNTIDDEKRRTNNVFPSKFERGCSSSH